MGMQSFLLYLIFGRCRLLLMNPGNGIETTMAGIRQLLFMLVSY